MTTEFEDAKSWPFQEARRLVDHIGRKGKKPGDIVTFETGYGPSGAPHIGTFAEIIRTLWVMRAFRKLTKDQYKTRLIMFSDDYDGMRKVPDGLPEWMNDHLGKPLSAVPNPYEEFPGDSFATANNLRLIELAVQIMDTTGEDLMEDHPTCRATFVSSTQTYQSGKFNDLLDRVWDNHEAILNIMLPTLGADRAATYSPFMVKGNDGTLIHDNVTLDTVRGYVKVGNRTVANIHDGGAKLQWKVDWAMRWVHFDVDYEMCGKDLTDSVKASSKICRVLGGTPPLNLIYELFLDENGEKISKTKGNGFSMEDWLTYGSLESLMMFLFQNPKQARKLHLELVPKTEEDLWAMSQRESIGPNDALWHFGPSASIPPVSYSLLLNLAVVSGATEVSRLVDYLAQSIDIQEETRENLEDMATRVIQYTTVKGMFDRERRLPNETERLAFLELAERFEGMPSGLDAEAYQFEVYEVGKKYQFEPLRAWFQSLYECLLGSENGPRFGALTVAYGWQETIDLLREAATRTEYDTK